MADGSDGFIEMGDYRATVYARQENDKWVAHVSFQRKKDLLLHQDRAPAHGSHAPGTFETLQAAIAGAHAYARECVDLGKTGL